MPRRRSNLGRCTRRAKALRQLILDQTEEERASAREQNRQRMARIRAEETAERRSARLEDARLRARQRRSAASDLLRSRQRKDNRLRAPEILQQKTADYNHLAFRYNPAEPRRRVARLMSLKVNDESHIDWMHVLSKFPGVSSPQYLQGYVSSNEENSQLPAARTDNVSRRSHSKVQMRSRNFSQVGEAVRKASVEMEINDDDDDDDECLVHNPNDKGIRVVIETMKEELDDDESIVLI